VEDVRAGKLKMLCYARLSKTDLLEANLIEANLTEANLTEANLPRANLSEANLAKATLYGAFLYGATLVGADLPDANLTDANLTEADLSRAGLYGANLSGAKLRHANLDRANLVGANLSEASLFLANLSGASLMGGSLAGANLFGANLASAIFEPTPDSIGSLKDIERAWNLWSLRYRDSPMALVQLRERFAKAGLRDLEREVTYAKLRSQRILTWTGSRKALFGVVETASLTDRFESAFSYVAFEITCGYGFRYGRPLRILGVTIPLFAFVYALSLRSRGGGAVWRIWPPDRIRKDQGQAEPERLSWETSRRPGDPRHSFLFKLCRALGLGLLFSLVSAFQIGWRELNVGNWITRLQPREYALRATGWVRVVAGVQSLLSVYLLALWVLSYFGRPFE